MIVLSEFSRIVELVLVVFVAFAISVDIHSSFLAANYPEALAVIVQWVSFFGMLLVYYKWIRARLGIDRYFEL